MILHFDRFQKEKIIFFRYKMVIRMITGYKRTGKDTLAAQLNGTSRIPFNWKVYRHRFVDFPIDQVLGSGPRVAFADAIKKEAIEELNRAGIYFDYEKYKDSYSFEYCGNPFTFRQFLQIKSQRNDPYHWCKKVIIEPNSIITDWRSYHEYPYVAMFGPVITIRIFRSSVPIPSYTDISERSLDNEMTDYVLTDDFNAFLRQFPQYEDYEDVPIDLDTSKFQSVGQPGTIRRDHQSNTKFP